MVIAGINIADADSLDAAADNVEDGENWITCPECDGTREIADYCPDAGCIASECPCCEGNGSILGVEPDRDPEPPAPAVPALAVVVPLVRRHTGRDTGRVVKPSACFAGKTVTGFCPDCTPHYDIAPGRFVNCGGDDTGGRLRRRCPTPVRFDRATHCQQTGQTGWGDRHSVRRPGQCCPYRQRRVRRCCVPCGRLRPRHPCTR